MGSTNACAPLLLAAGGCRGYEGTALPMARAGPLQVGAFGAQLFCVQNLRRVACAAYSRITAARPLPCQPRSMLHGCKTYCYTQQGALTSRFGHNNGANSILAGQHATTLATLQSHFSSNPGAQGNSSSRGSTPGPLKPYGTHPTGLAFCR